ncbi:hypothetical protein NDU88_009690 [Pleurodeles waltl]|uniref:Uncharacterized protein n=1 Tax=Pleurodeles waltl TaxID=8319 RepID=A0AAV7PZR1_PLEWA|nr:hypothetical protein NDU88_009690 [Pleurodeles waltl]
MVGRQIGGGGRDGPVQPWGVDPDLARGARRPRRCSLLWRLRSELVSGAGYPLSSFPLLPPRSGVGDLVVAPLGSCDGALILCSCGARSGAWLSSGPLR